MGAFSEHEDVIKALAEMKGLAVGRPRLDLDGRRLDPEAVEAALEQFVSPERRERIERVLAARTRTVVPVIEGIVNMGNVSAVMRTAEALGYQDLHLVTGGTRFKNSRRTSIGAEKWLDVYHWPTPGDCARALESAGYRIVVAHLDPDARDVSMIDFTQKTAIVLGNELEGVSQEMLDRAHDRCILPMAGFAQSYNVSVAAALFLYHAHQQRRERLGAHGDLSEAERLELRASYYIGSVRAGRQIVRRMLRTAT